MSEASLGTLVPTVCATKELIVISTTSRRRAMVAGVAFGATDSFYSATKDAVFTCVDATLAAALCTRTGIVINPSLTTCPASTSKRVS